MKSKEQVNHPEHYNQYPVEAIEIMLKVFGMEAVYNFCLLNAFKYRMRLGIKSQDLANLQNDLDKEAWYLKMAAVYRRPEMDANVNVIDKKKEEKDEK